MRGVIPLSILLGLVWNAMVVCLMGGKVTEAFRPSWLMAGVLAGIVSGLFTVWSRNRRDGEESIFYGVATFYIGIVTYWASFVVVERTLMCLRHGGWTAFDLRDHLIMIWTFAIYGTLWFGIILIPLGFFSRYLIWKVYLRFAR